MLLSMEDAAALSARIEAAFDAGREDAVLQVAMPNGKAFGSCAAEDIREIGKAYNGLAARHALTPCGMLARRFFNGVYLEMAAARLGQAALDQSGYDVERAKLVLRRAMAADPVILTHLLECALDDEVSATLCALKAKADEPARPGSEETASGALMDVFPDGLASFHELASGRQFGDADMRGATHYELAAQCALEQIRSAASLPADGAGQVAEGSAADAAAGLGSHGESRAAIQRWDHLPLNWAATEADCDPDHPGPSLPMPETLDVRELPGLRP